MKRVPAQAWGLVVGFVAALSVCAQDKFTADMGELRVGIVSYNEMSRADLKQFSDYFKDLRDEKGERIKVSLAFGGYEDIEYWLSKKYIDVARITPGLFARNLLERGANGLAYQYLATECLPADGADPESYAPACYVCADSKLKTVEDLKAALEQERMRFIFVDPSSASGKILPYVAIHKATGLNAIRLAQLEYSYHHTRSLEKLARQTSTSGLEWMAFVHDQQGRQIPVGVKRFDALNLNEYRIPGDLWVAHPDLSAARVKLVSAHLCASAGKFKRDYNEGDPKSREAFEGRFAAIKDGIDKLERSENGQKPSAGIYFDDLLNKIRSYEAVNKRSRIALVLSGGGAKCSYEVGVVAELERALDAYNKDPVNQGLPPLDFNLVVGTSGGAINALPVASGMTQPLPKGEATPLEKAWVNIRLAEIARLYGWPKLPIACSLTVVWVCLYQLLRFVIRPKKGFSAADLLCWLTALVVGYIALNFGLYRIVICFMTEANFFKDVKCMFYTDLIFKNPNIVYGTLFIVAILYTMNGVYGFLGFADKLAAKGDEKLTHRGRNVRWMIIGTLLITMIFILPLLTAVLLFASNPSMFEGQGLEDVVTARYAEIYDKDKALSAEMLSTKLVTQERPLKRDLVITGSCINLSLLAKIPTDLYFYMPNTMGPVLEPEYGKHGIRIVNTSGGLGTIDHSQLLNITLGSGSIFPVFPAREIKDFPISGISTRVIDGGFAHNSPVEAAVNWGATHIIMIEATALSEKVEHTSMAGNFLGAFDHLFDQAQLIDVRSREAVYIYTIRPKAGPDSISVLDFNARMIQAAINRGKRDAKEPNFEKQLGQPRLIPCD